CCSRCSIDAKEAGVFKHILVGLDGSAGSLRALEAAAALAREFGATLEAISVAEDVRRFAATVGEVEEEREAAQMHLQEVQERAIWRTLARGFEEGAAPDAVGLNQVERWRPKHLYADRNSEAEYAFCRLPGRFHRYAAEYLFASERILAFVPWTAALTESWWS